MRLNVYAMVVRDRIGRRDKEIEVMKMSQLARKSDLRRLAETLEKNFELLLISSAAALKPTLK